MEWPLGCGSFDPDPDVRNRPARLRTRRRCRRARSGPRPRKAWNQAYKAGDTKALASILDNSLVLVEDDGSLKTKSEFLASVKASSANQEQVAPESLTVRVFGNTAIAIGVIAVRGTQRGKSVVHRERFIDTWIYKNGTWICIATDATPITHAGTT
jgi:ketosteroid isomerase-like protein